MNIEILCTGDEVLTGKITNTNFSYVSQKLEDAGLTVVWGTTVGDDRDRLEEAFRLAAGRADAVIVNGGLGPTVDDLSQEIAAAAAGVPLVLNEEWLARMESFFSRRSRIMPPNNRKQAMLPEGAEVLDNPVGTACGFALDIGGARFFFTTGVPRELQPQLETKLTIRGTSPDDVARKLEPVTAEVRRRLGNFILAEDDQTLEGVVLAALAAQDGSLALVETFTAGQIAARLAHLPGAEALFRRGIVLRDLTSLGAAVGLEDGPALGPLSQATAEAVARAARAASGATHALAVLIELDEGADAIDFGGTIHLAIATAGAVSYRRSRILGGREWVRLGAVEL